MFEILINYLKQTHLVLLYIQPDAEMGLDLQYNCAMLKLANKKIKLD
jgi:hypothetical protein